MWTRTYLVLLLVRLYFAISPSYIHPDENFQGPEVIAGKLFNFAHHQTWEFTTSRPVRSIFPLWPVYALPMLVLKGIWAGIGTGEVPPSIIYYSLRVLFFILSFVLEDWAIHDLVQSPRHRRLAITLVASSYVTWTYQTHTFSNSIETLAVLWSLVMVQRILENKQRPSLLSSAIFGILLTFGGFNRVTFPAYLVFPSLFLLPHFYRHPLSLMTMICTALSTAAIAIGTDTEFYRPDASLRTLFIDPIVTPLNSFLYNSQTSNLSSHGLHPHYQHLIGSLPLLLGPALLLLPSASSNSNRLPIISAVAGTAFLSIIPHQEARFLLPVVPLVLCSIHLPHSKRHTRYWLASWVVFNGVLAVLMGIYHQGGVIDMQTWIGQNHQVHQADTLTERGSTSNDNAMTHIFWWRTYSPPIYLLGSRQTINTTDLMGISHADLQQTLLHALENANSDSHENGSVSVSVGLVAPYSSLDLDLWSSSSPSSSSSIISNLKLKEVHRVTRHINLDDLDFTADGGVLGTLRRVIGRRGLVLWTVEHS